MVLSGLTSVGSSICYADIFKIVHHNCRLVNGNFVQVFEVSLANDSLTALAKSTAQCDASCSCIFQIAACNRLTEA